MIRSFAFLSFLAMTLFASPAVRADVIFSILQTNPGDLLLDSTATFDVVARTDAGTQSFQAITFDFSLDNKTGAGGKLVEPATNNLGGPGWAILDSYTALYDGLPSASITSLNTSNTLLGRITLSTVGAQLGTFTLRVAGVDVTPLTGSVTSFGGTLNYTISAVPEPTSMALVAVAGVGALWGYRRRSKAS